MEGHEHQPTHSLTDRNPIAPRLYLISKSSFFDKGQSSGSSQGGVMKKTGLVPGVFGSAGTGMGIAGWVDSLPSGWETAHRRSCGKEEH
jgi:hypothetical protein